MKWDDILEKISTLLVVIGMIIWGYNFFKKDDPHPTQNKSKYDIKEYRKQQNEIKESNEECLQIVKDYLKRYGYNVTYIYTTDASLNDWKYNVRGTITNPDGTTRHFGVMYDYTTKSITTFDID